MDSEMRGVDGYLHSVEEPDPVSAPSPSPHSPCLTPDISMQFIFILAVVRISSKELHLLCTLGCPVSFNVREKMPRTTHCMSGQRESSSVGGLAFPLLFLSRNGTCLSPLSNVEHFCVVVSSCFVHLSVDFSVVALVT